MVLERHSMTRRDIIDQEGCLGKLAQVVESLGPRWSVQPFGSFANGCGTRGSDLDATCYCEGIKQQDNHLALDELRQKLRPLLKLQPRFEIIEEVWGARIPLLKLKFDGHIDVDLSCHNPQALQNTHLLRAYANLDPAIRDFLVATKLWAKQQGICGAASGHLSSYALTMMSLFFLQVDPEVQMPCLPVSACAPSGFISDIAISWSCPLSVSALLSRFFHFFATTFWWGGEVIAVRFGRRIRATDSSFRNLPGRNMSRLHIEDPFLEGRNLNCTLGSEQETKLHEQFQCAVEAFQSGVLPSGLTLAMTGQSALQHDVLVVDDTKQLAHCAGGVELKPFYLGGARQKRLYSQGGSDAESTASGESVILAQSSSSPILADVSGESDSDDSPAVVSVLPKTSAAALWLGPEMPSTTKVLTTVFQ